MSAKTATMLAKSHFSDSLQSNEVIEKMLSIEGKCIAGILTNCNSNIETAAILPTFLCLNNVSSIVDEELRRELQNHQMLEEKLKTLGGLQQESDREQGRKNETAQVEEGIKNSFRNLLRLFRACSDVVSAWKAELKMEVGMSEKVRELQESLNLILEKSLSSWDKRQQHPLSKLHLQSTDPEIEDIASLKDFNAQMKEVDAKVRPQAANEAFIGNNQD